MVTTCSALLAGPAFAQETSPAPAEPPLSISSVELFKVNEAKGGPVLATFIIGQSVYNSDANDAENIGKLSDFVIGPDGKIQSVIIGVGGFLGVGQKEVSKPVEEIKLSLRSDGRTWLVLNSTKEELQAAPAFDRSKALPDEQATGSVTPSTPAAPEAPMSPSQAPEASPEHEPVTPPEQ